MANLELLVTLLRAVAAKTHVVLVGDADQLAPVGAGKPFAELIALRVGAGRPADAHLPPGGGQHDRPGRARDPPRRDAQLRAGPDMRRDLFLIERTDARAAREEIVVAGVRPAARRTTASIPSATSRCSRPSTAASSGSTRSTTPCATRSTRDGQPVARWSPADRRQADDDRAQPPRARPDERHAAAAARRGLPREDSDGDETTTRCCSPPTSRSSGFPPEQSERLRLAYACSVHRGQGIELPVAVIVAHPAAGAFFLRREMLYTAVTRAKIATVIVGTPRGRGPRRPDARHRSAPQPPRRAPDPIARKDLNADPRAELAFRPQAARARPVRRAASRYDRIGAVLSFGQDPRWRRALLAAVDPRSGQRVLDVAAGTGLVAFGLAEHQCEVVGLDQSEAMLAAARSRLAGMPWLTAA